MDQKQEKAIKRIEVVAKLMDSQFRIPGTGIRFGLDPILGLFPVVGDFTGYLIGVYLAIEMYKNGASGKLVVKMMGNLLLDAILGSIPLIGLIPDIWYKANMRNMRLLKAHYQEGKHQGSGLKIIIVIFIISILVITGIFYLLIRLFEYIF